MSAGKYTIDVEQGATFTRTLTWKDSSGVVRDLTGYTANLSVRKALGTSVILALSIGNGIEIPTPTNGKIIITITETQTTALVANNYKFQLNMINGIVETRLVEGAFNVDAEV